VALARQGAFWIETRNALVSVTAFKMKQASLAGVVIAAA
jgi:hypothetical protein